MKLSLSRQILLDGVCVQQTMKTSNYIKTSHTA